MKKTFTLVFFFSSLFTLKAQIASTLTNLQTPALDETSGLLYYNNKLITHNDSGGEAKLYEVNTSTGAITRTVTIMNALNVDWEDLAQDDLYLYIGDIGNNSGNRTDLKIYKISKADYDDADNTATAETISYSYANQVDFTANVNNTNWDAEAFISYGNNLLIFSKNWADNMVNVYSIPKATGTHSAVLQSSYTTNGIITGADSSPDESVIYLTGYSTSEAPFMYTIHNIPNNSLNVFSGTTSAKITNIVPIGNQVEGVALFEITPTKHRLYITNENYILSLFGGLVTIPFPAKLWVIELDSENLNLAVPEIPLADPLEIYPNPFDKILKLSDTVDEIIIYDMLGKQITKQQFVKEISLDHLDKGVYIAHLKINNSILIRKIIKN